MTGHAHSPPHDIEERPSRIARVDSTDFDSIRVRNASPMTFDGPSAFGAGQRERGRGRARAARAAGGDDSSTGSLSPSRSAGVSPVPSPDPGSAASVLVGRAVSRGRLARFDSADDLAIGRGARPAIPDCGGAGGLPLPPPLAAGSAEVTTVSPPPSGGNAAALLASRAVRGRFARFDATDSVAESPAAPAVVAGGPAAHPASAAVPSIAISPAPPLSASAVLAQRAVHGQSRLMRYDSADDLAGS